MGYTTPVFKKGNYYTATSRNKSNDEIDYIFQCTEDNNLYVSTKMLLVYTEAYESHDYGFDTSDLEDFYFKEATFEQIAWLKACIEADDFVPFEEVKLNVNYEIY